MVTVISIADMNELHHLGMAAFPPVLFWPAETETSASNLVDSTRANALVLTPSCGAILSASSVYSTQTLYILCQPFISSEILGFHIHANTLVESKRLLALVSVSAGQKSTAGKTGTPWRYSSFISAMNNSQIRGEPKENAIS